MTFMPIDKVLINIFLVSDLVRLRDLLEEEDPCNLLIVEFLVYSKVVIVGLISPSRLNLIPYRKSGMSQFYVSSLKGP